MTKDEISKFADLITSTYQRITIHFHEHDDNNGIVGYFDENGDYELRKKNIWKFVRTPILDPKNKFTIINGEEIKRIELVTFPPGNY